MGVEGAAGVTDSTGGVGHLGVKGALVAGFDSVFSDHGLLGGDDFFFRRTEIELEDQAMQRLFAGDADLAIHCDTGGFANYLGLHYFRIGGFLRFLLRAGGEKSQH